MNTTVITVHTVNKGKVVSTCTKTLKGWQVTRSLKSAIGECLETAAERAAHMWIDMTMPDTSFRVEIRHLHDGHM